MTPVELFPGPDFLFAHDSGPYPTSYSDRIPMQTIAIPIDTGGRTCGTINDHGVLFRTHPEGFLISLN